MTAKVNNPLFLSRPLLALILLVSELMLLSLVVDARAIETRGIVSVVLSESGRLVRWLVVSIGVVVVGLSSGFMARTAVLNSRVPQKSLCVALVFHLTSFAGLVLVTTSLFRADAETTVVGGALWVLMVALTLLSWCLVIVARAGWEAFLRNERKLLLLALAAGALIYFLGDASSRYWTAMSGFTLQMTAIVLTAFYDVITLDVQHNVIGAREFWVNVDQACSGMEGMVVSSMITAVYLYLSRDQLRFPRALLLLPIACALSAVLNIGRIALLVLIGAEWNPDIAVKGFHSVAGWIGTVLVALLVVFSFSNWRWIHRTESESSALVNDSGDVALATAILAPFLLFLSLSLLAKIFVEEFNYLYPVIIALVSLALTAAWRRYALGPPHRVVASIATGVVIAALWVVLDSHDMASSHVDFAALAVLPVWQATIWALLRLVGFVVVTPLMEELVFRGYLLARLSGDGVRLNEQPAYRFWPLLASSVLFGLLHPGWLAGIAAGVAFALLRYHSNRIADCILAHGVANGLLAIWFTLTWFNRL